MNGGSTQAAFLRRTGGRKVILHKAMQGKKSSELKAKNASHGGGGTGAGVESVAVTHPPFVS